MEISLDCLEFFEYCGKLFFLSMLTLSSKWGSSPENFVTSNWNYANLPYFQISTENGILFLQRNATSVSEFLNAFLEISHSEFLMKMLLLLNYVMKWTLVHSIMQEKGKRAEVEKDWIMSHKRKNPKMLFYRTKGCGWLVKLLCSWSKSWTHWTLLHYAFKRRRVDRKEQ
jgi:hypothetical protein